MSLDGSSVLVTGGTRGIGLAIAHRLVRDGAGRVVLGYMRNDAAAEAAAAELGKAGVEVDLVRGNVASESTIAKLAAAGPYRVVVHNAATGVIRPALETEDKHWDWTMNANARSMLALTRATAPAMEAGSSIVAISSLGSQRVLDNYILIGTSKAALESVCATSRSSSRRAGSASTRSRPASSTPRRSSGSRTRTRCSRTVDRTPAGRLVEPDDVAAAVSFLCSGDAAMVCGQTLVVDGGFSLPA